MINTEKEYWFAFEPYVFITLKEKAALLYNTLDGEHIKVTNKDAIAFVSEVLDKKNCGVVRITANEWSSENIYNLLIEIRNKFFGDLYECSLSHRKPIQLYPALNLQEEVNRLLNYDSEYVVTKMFTYLYKITVDIEELEGEALCALMDEVWEQVRSGSLKHLCIIIYTASQLQTLRTWLENHEEATGCVEWMMKAELAFNDRHGINEPATIIMNAEDIPAGNLPHAGNSSVSWIFRVHTEDELETVSSLIDRYELQHYKIEPVYDNTNLPFFEEQVFLEKEDIFSKPVSMQEIMRNQVLNTHKFGKLFVSSNGDVRAGSVLEAPIGNLHAENIRRLVHKEMTEGKSWLHIRNQKPCCDCIYQWLCPSPSDYESVIGRPNLCHIEE